MAKTQTPTIKEIIQKLIRTGFRRVRKKALVTKGKSITYNSKNIEDNVPLLMVRESKTRYRRKKK